MTQIVYFYPAEGDGTFLRTAGTCKARFRCTRPCAFSRVLRERAPRERVAREGAVWRHEGAINTVQAFQLGCVVAGSEIGLLRLLSLEQACFGTCCQGRQLNRWQEVTAGFGKLHSEELHNLHPKWDVIWSTKRKEMKCASARSRCWVVPEIMSWVKTHFTLLTVVSCCPWLATDC
jgi:hypothetical protein